MTDSGKALLNVPAGARRFYLPTGHDEVLADSESLNNMTGFVQCVMAAGRPMVSILSAFRSGKGIPFEAYGHDMREGIGRTNRAMYLQQLGRDWIPMMPDVDEQLRTAESPRVADIGCGAGYGSIGVAMAYPEARVEAFDLDQASIEDARRNAAEAGVEDRVSFQVKDAAEAGPDGSFDLVMALECIHDMPQPVAALETMRRLVKPGGAVFVVDERVNDRFTTEGDDVERVMYGFSVTHCLPSGMCGHSPAGTGTVMRTSTMRAYAKAAGFDEVEVLPIENTFFRFYRLR